MKKILAIDDSENNLILMKSILQKKLSDYEILLAKSGIEGIKIAKRELPDTILLDIYMPNMDGYEVCRILKEDEITKSIPVLMVSAYGNDTKVRVKGLNAGADAFITKPYQMSEFVALINVMLRIKNAEDLLRKQNQYLESNISKLTKAEKTQKKSLNQINKYQKKLKKLNSELILTEEKEKKAIAEYLHDSIGQTLSIANIKLTSLLNKELTPRISKGIVEVSNLIDNAINESRLLTYDLSPPILYELGLVPAIKWKLNQVEEKTGISTIFTGSKMPISINNNSRILIYRIVCELLLNVVKHAKADIIKIEIDNKNKNLYISVVDNGIGYDFKKTSRLKKPGGYGLFSINERLDSINGKFVLNSNPRLGTSAQIIVPV